MARGEGAAVGGKRAARQASPVASTHRQRAGQAQFGLRRQSAGVPIVIENDQIEETRISNLSIMPEGQLDLLKEDQVADLVKYLQSPEQVPLP